jgi:hypothetical protein
MRPAAQEVDMDNHNFLFQELHVVSHWEYLSPVCSPCALLTRECVLALPSFVKSGWDQLARMATTEIGKQIFKIVSSRSAYLMKYLHMCFYSMRWLTIQGDDGGSQGTVIWDVFISRSLRAWTWDRLEKTIMKKDPRANIYEVYRFFSTVELKIWPTEFAEFWKMLDLLILVGVRIKYFRFFKAAIICPHCFWGLETMDTSDLL